MPALSRFGSSSSSRPLSNIWLGSPIFYHGWGFQGFVIIIIFDKTTINNVSNIWDSDRSFCNVCAENNNIIWYVIFKSCFKSMWFNHIFFLQNRNCRFRFTLCQWFILSLLNQFLFQIRGSNPCRGGSNFFGLFFIL